ncbi:MAG: hypothetical protein R3185_08610, partial [Candidatus Thermoplasmatota archaeon]|nr:hypothetical protein [Candidatus Thermoplasmatota archaeon]
MNPAWFPVAQASGTLAEPAFIVSLVAFVALSLAGLVAWLSHRTQSLEGTVEETGRAVREQQEINATILQAETEMGQGL